MLPKQRFILILTLAALCGTFYFFKGRVAPLSGSTSELVVSGKASDETANLAATGTPLSPNPLLVRAINQERSAVPPSSENTANVVSKLTALDQKKYQVLMEIFATRNDNDPRLDTELTNLSAELKNTLQSFYQQTAPEKRNERGTVVFLIARSLETQRDLDFLKSVLAEPACLSLSDCRKAAPVATGEQAHLDGLNATTANYPQLTAIRQSAEAYERLAKGDSGNQTLANSLIEMLKEAARGPNERVAEEAKSALLKLGKWAE